MKILQKNPYESPQAVVVYINIELCQVVYGSGGRTIDDGDDGYDDDF